MPKRQSAESYIHTNFKILTKAGEGGISKLVPMRLLPVQKYYVDHGSHRDIVLKGRQMGLSTGIMALNAQRVFRHKFTKMSIVAHNQDTAEFLFMTIKRFHRNMPDKNRPDARLNSMARMLIPDMDCFMHIASAESRAIGFGETLNIAHLSEVSRWPASSAHELFAGMTQTVPQKGYITMESTPRGRGGLFYDYYHAAKRGDINYKTFFFPWWFDPNYKREIKEKLVLTEEENDLMRHYDLTEEQIAFRREKISELGDLFYQEYPENDIDCWLSGEMSVFDGMAIRRYLQQCNDGKQEGLFTIWKDAIGGERYVIGVDAAAGKEKGDYSVGSVLHLRRNEYVARLRGRMPPDLFTQELMRLGRRFNDATIAVERTNHGYLVLKILMENNYPNLYYHKDYDSFTGVVNMEPGWKTSPKTKPIMVDTMKATIRSFDLGAWSENLFDEASKYMYEGINENKYKTVSGGHDDELDAVMIALQARDSEPVIEERRYRPSTYATI